MEATAAAGLPGEAAEVESSLMATQRDPTTSPVAETKSRVSSKVEPLTRSSWRSLSANAALPTGAAAAAAAESSKERCKAKVTGCQSPGASSPGTSSTNWDVANVFWPGAQTSVRSP